MQQSRNIGKVLIMRNLFWAAMATISMLACEKPMEEGKGGSNSLYEGAVLSAPKQGDLYISRGFGECVNDGYFSYWDCGHD